MAVAIWNRTNFWWVGDSILLLNMKKCTPRLPAGQPPSTKTANRGLLYCWLQSPSTTLLCSCGAPASVSPPTCRCAERRRCFEKRRTLSWGHIACLSRDSPPSRRGRRRRCPSVLRLWKVGGRGRRCFSSFKLNAVIYYHSFSAFFYEEHGWWPGYSYCDHLLIVPPSKTSSYVSPLMPSCILLRNWANFASSYCEMGTVLERSMVGTCSSFSMLI